MGEASEVGSGLKTAAKDAFKEVMDVVSEWVAPLAGLGVGWLIGSVTGGQTAVAAALGPILNPKNLASMYPTEHVIGGVVMFAIEGGVGFGLLAAAHGMKGNIGKSILKFFGGVGIGAGLFNLVGGLTNSGYQGSLDTAILNIEHSIEGSIPGGSS